MGGGQRQLAPEFLVMPLLMGPVSLFKTMPP